MAHEQVCARVPVSRVRKILPAKYLEAMEHNQKIAHCCRHPENHDIEAHKSSPDQQGPDIYTFHCKCGRKHTRFMTGGGKRPMWNAA